MIALIIGIFLVGIWAIIADYIASKTKTGFLWTFLFGLSGTLVAIALQVRDNTQKPTNWIERLSDRLNGSPAPHENSHLLEENPVPQKDLIKDYYSKIWTENYSKIWTEKEQSEEKID